MAHDSSDYLEGLKALAEARKPNFEEPDTIKAGDRRHGVYRGWLSISPIFG